MAWATGTGLGRSRTPLSGRTSWSLAACLIACATCARSADAQGAVLRWTTVPGCPSRAAFEDRLAEYLGATPAADTRVAVAIERGHEALLIARITVDRNGRSGTRVLRDADCAVLADAAAFAAAVLIDPAITPGPGPRGPLAVTPDAGDAEGVSRRAPDVAPDARSATADQPRQNVDEPRPAPSAEPATPSPAVERASIGDVLVLRAEVAGALGVLPGVAPGAGLAIGYDLSARLRVELLGRLLPTRPARDPHVPGTAGEVGLWDIGYRACALFSDGSPELPLCVGGRAGSMFGRGGEALQDRQTDSVFWLALELAFGLRWPLSSWLALQAEVSPLLPLVRPDFRVEGVGTIHQSAAVALAASAGLEVRLR